MADPRFYQRAGPFSLAQLADIAGGRLNDDTLAHKVIHDVAPLDRAAAGEISFLDNKKYADAFRASRADACLVRAEAESQAPKGMALILCKDPYRGYAQVAAAFYPVPKVAPGIASTAFVDKSAIVGADCQIDPGAVIMARAEIGTNVRIGANAVIGEAVVIGDDCVIGPNVTISHAIIGKRAFFHPGVSIGQDGFGFAMGSPHLKVPQLGRVIIDDDVEIGANSTVDRGAGPDTVIGAGCKIDNLVQIGHNVQIGRGCILVAQSGIAGSSKLGDFVIVAAQVGVIGHLTVGTGARIGGQSGVIRDVKPGETIGGTPGVPMQQWLRQSAALARLAQKKGQ